MQSEASRQPTNSASTAIDQHNTKQRIEDLINQMTLEEKVAQMNYDAPVNARLGIPKLRFNNCLHGVRIGPLDCAIGEQATSFPQMISLGCSWDPDLLEQVGAAIAREARALQVHITYSPVLDVARDPRWGRNEECLGEDPLLVARLGVAMIHGLQGRGDERLNHEHVLATAKHFAGHGQPQSGLNGAPMDVSDRTMREIHLPPFEAAVKDARVGAVMPAHTDINGIPCHANESLLRGLLRGDWGFSGLIISDNRDIMRLHNMHCIARDMIEAASIALRAGVEMEISREETATPGFEKPLIEAVQNGIVEEWRVDAAVRRILAVKMELGLFEEAAQPPVEQVVNTPQNRELAREAARRSIVLLKNEHHMLPLDAQRLNKVALIGPHAAETPLGSYTGENKAHVVSLLEAMRDHLKGQAEVIHARGCDVVELACDGFEPAVEAARGAEVAIVAVGDTEATCREGVDRDCLDLHGVQEDLVRAVHATGTPVIVVLMNGRPMTINWIDEHVPAILEAWYPGVEGGAALAEILLGKVNPSGKLTVTFPRSVGHLPLSYLQKPEYTGRGNGQYLDSDSTPLYSFSHGLSYTRFDYSEPVLSRDRIKAEETTELAVRITNSGPMDGEEVVQLYVHDHYSSVTRYMMELKDFKRVAIAAGETIDVVFTIGFEQLRMLNAQLEWVVEPGLFDLMVGGNINETHQVSLEVTP